MSVQVVTNDCEYLRHPAADPRHRLVNLLLADMDRVRTAKYPTVALAEYHIRLSHELESNTLRLVDRRLLRNHIVHLI